MKLILWAAGINGEGSSIVAFNLIKSLIEHYDKLNFNVVISAKSTLEEKLDDINLLDNSKILRLPRIYRLYPVQVLAKTIINMNYYCEALITLDDYPFRNASNQILYFHQPNLIFSEKLIWKFKRLFFNFLRTKQLKIFLQTKHIYNSFLNKFIDISNTKVFFALHFDN